MEQEKCDIINRLHYAGASIPFYVKKAKYVKQGIKSIPIYTKHN